MKRRLFVPHEPSPSLPPSEVIVYDPRKKGRLKTPLDERGLVKTADLIHLVKQTVDPHYTWGSDPNNEHHLQWPDRAYNELPFRSDINPQEFRNLSISKLYAPKSFHNWLHLVTEPPPVPSEEVMYHRIESQRVVLALYKNMQISRMLLRNKRISDTALQERLTQNFDEFSLALEDAQKIPHEFQLVDVTNFSPKNTFDLFKISSALGKAAAVPIATRSVRMAAAA